VVASKADRRVLRSAFLWFGRDAVATQSQDLFGYESVVAAGL